MAAAQFNGSQYAIDLGNFSRRLQALYSHWEEHKDELWGSADIFVVATPPPPSNCALRYVKSSTLSNWLLGYEFPNTIMVFFGNPKKQIHFLCSTMQASLLETVRTCAKDSLDIDITFHVKQKYDYGVSQMDAVLLSMQHSQSMSDQGICYALIVGHIVGEAFDEGGLSEKWADKLKSSGDFELCDVSSGIAKLFVVKEQNEIAFVRKAAYLTASVMRYFVLPTLETAIDQKKEITHSGLTEETEKVIDNPARIKVRLNAENVDICYLPIFQSGKSFDLGPNASSNDDNLFFDTNGVIICAIGSRYNNYCSNIARTFLIDKVLLKAHDAAVGALKPGKLVSVVYQAAVAVVTESAPELLPNLTKSAGTGIGLELCESGLTLDANNDRLIKAWMVFNVSFGFQDLETESAANAKARNFSLLVADTIIVTNDGHDVVTQLCSNGVRDRCLLHYQ